MRAKSLHIRNFRSIREASIELNDQTAILGPNGAGKSTILRALDRFYGQSTQMEPDDFFGRAFQNVIEIGITFDSFTEEERDQFGSRIHDDAMTVVRTFEAGSRNSGRYYGMSMQHGGFEPVHAAEGALAKRQAYNQLRDAGGIYADLPAATNVQQVSDGMSAWQDAHPDQCEPMLDDGQFFGFTNVAKGLLSRASIFVFIPAVRDASTDATDAKGAVVAQLIELLVRSAIQQRDDIRQWQVQTSDQYRELTNPQNLHELGDLSGQLSDTLRVFYRDATVELQWKPTNDLTIPLPTADVLLNDDGFEGPVDRKGHGLQRALILTLLQHLAVAVSVRDADQDASAEADEGAAEVAVPEVETPPAPMPGLILAIEEPELYQHPTKQKHFANVLTSLSKGSLPGVAANTQIVFASHSPLFVSTDRFDEIRLARRQLIEGQEFKECRIATATLQRVAERLEFAWNRPPGTFNAEGVRGRLHIINQEVAEGFFADLAVLVEGPGDRAAILAMAKLLDLDLEASGIAILAAGGKNNIDRPALIFEGLGIPTYLVWDCDNGNGLETNRALSRIAGCPAGQLCESETRITATFSCFESNLEAILEAEIPDLEACINEVRDEYGIVKKDDVLKSAFAMGEVLNKAAEREQQSQTLRSVVEAIAGGAY